MVLLFSFLLFVGIWHLHMPGSFNSIMPSEVNNLDDWIELPRWQIRSIVGTVCTLPGRAFRGPRSLGSAASG